MWSPCSSIRSLTPRPLAPLPPSRHPSWYTVMLSKRSCQPGLLSHIAAAIAPAPPPKIATRDSRPSCISAAPPQRVPKDFTPPDHEIELEPECEPRCDGIRIDSQLAAKR